MDTLKLCVEVVGAHELIAKDGQGSCTTFVELHFDGQKFRTTTKDKDLSPIWNEIFYFNITDPTKLPNLTLDVFLYHYNQSSGSKISLGKVTLTGTSFVPYSDALVLHYPLEKKSIFSRTKGELGLKVFITDDPSIRPSNPFPPMESSMDQILNNLSKKKNETRHTFHNIPKSSDEKEKKFSSPMIHEMKSSGPAAPTVVQAFAGAMDYVVKETSPSLGGGKVVGGRVIKANTPSSTYDLVESMEYLFVRVVKARDLPSMDVTGSLDPYVEVRIGNFKGTIRYSY